MDATVVKSVRTVEELGQKQFQEFCTTRLDERKISLFDVIKRNKIQLFSSPPAPKETTKDKMKIASLKSNCSLFSRLYISCQVREGDLDSFFTHENQSYPPSLSQYGTLRSGNKSDLLFCLERLCPAKAEKPSVDVLLLDGAAIVNMLKPTGACKTFAEYSQFVFIPYVTRELESVKRVDVVWDRYLSNSLKDCTRRKRGNGSRRRVQPDTKIPGNWAAFLRVDENKVELFHFLAKQLITISNVRGQVVTTKDESVLFNNERHDITNLAPCGHEEADTRLLLHVADAANQGFTKVVVRTVDTDVVVISVATFHQIQLSELWVAFGTGKHFRYLSVHDICKRIGPIKSQALLALHAFFGCDQTSFFAHRGKKTAWEAWDAFSEVTTSFQVLSDAPTLEDVCEQLQLPTLERYVIIMYDRSNTCKEVNEARRDLFTRKGIDIEGIPPMADALRLHTKRCAYQAGHCWGKALVPSHPLPCPSEWGWVQSASQV